MRTLATDTTSEFGSLALVDSGQIIAEIPLHSPEGFSLVLFDQLRSFLSRHGWDLHSIDCFAAASGPGSFTGVRVGLAAMKGLAEAAGKRAAAVSNLQALAYYGTGSAIGVISDARRGEVYGAVYDDRLVAIAPERVQTFAAWNASLPEILSSVVTPDFGPFRNSFSRIVPIIEQRTIAGAVALFAERSAPQDTAALDANYVRRSDAELFWKDR